MDSVKTGNKTSVLKLLNKSNKISGCSSASGNLELPASSTSGNHLLPSFVHNTFNKHCFIKLSKTSEGEESIDVFLVTNDKCVIGESFLNLKVTPS